MSDLSVGLLLSSLFTLAVFSVSGDLVYRRVLRFLLRAEEERYRAEVIRIAPLLAKMRECSEASGRLLAEAAQLLAPSTADDEAAPVADRETSRTSVSVDTLSDK